MPTRAVRVEAEADNRPPLPRPPQMSPAEREIANCRAQTMKLDDDLIGQWWDRFDLAKKRRDEKYKAEEFGEAALAQADMDNHLSRIQKRQRELQDALMRERYPDPPKSKGKGKSSKGKGGGPGDYKRPRYG